MRFGSFNAIFFRLCLTLNAAVCFSAEAQEDKKKTFEITVDELRKKDDLENLTYLFLDTYLKEPTEERLILFDKYENLKWRIPATKNEQLAYTVLLCNKGYYLTTFGYPFNAVDAYEKAWQFFGNHSLTDFDIIEYCLKPLANNYSMLGDYINAESIVKNYLFIAEKEKRSDHVAAALINLSIIYHATGKNNDAISLLQQALTIRGITNEQTALVYSGLSRNYLSLKDLHKAKNFSHNALAILKKQKGTASSVQTVNVYSLLSEISLEDKKTEESFSFITKAQQLAAANRSAFKPRELAKLNNSYAGLLQQRDSKKALETYGESLKVLLPNYSFTKTKTPPQASSLYAENTLKETFDGIAQAYLNLNELEKALLYFELSFVVEDLIRATYSYDDAKLQQQIENRNRTERALEILYTLHQKTNASLHAAHAFQLAERTKAVTLKEKINSQTTKHRASDDSLFVQERALRYKQATLASAISIEQLKQDQMNLDHMHDLLEQQARIVISLNEVEKAIDLKYDSHRDLTSVQQIDLRRLQRDLKQSNAILLEYFAGNNALYIFQISSSSVELKRVEQIDSLKIKIIQLNKLLASSSAINNNIEEYSKTAFALFKILKLPLGLPEKKLIVIPDGVLSIIPFDALLYEPVHHSNYASFPFVLRSFTIAYQLSADVYLKSKKLSTKKSNTLLGMFPVFENTAQALHYSKQEAANIKNHVEGTFLFNEAATKKTFVEKLEDYSIIHLSTHASSGSLYEPPSITFIDSTLYLPQIYGFKMNTDLLVLSACETGSGTLVKGEGAISLARGFQLAGVQRLIFSLWKVNDYSTATLMSGFYKHLSSIDSRDESLQQAKLDYLLDESISNNRKSPYYWSGFVYYGHVDRAENKNNTILYVIILLAAIFSCFALWSVFLRKKSLH